MGADSSKKQVESQRRRGMQNGSRPQDPVALSAGRASQELPSEQPQILKGKLTVAAVLQKAVLCLAGDCKGFLKQQRKTPSLPGAVAVGRTLENPRQPLRGEGVGFQICKPLLWVPIIVMCHLSMLCDFQTHPAACPPRRLLSLVASPH